VLVAVTGLAMLVAFDTAFTVFHGLFFEGDSWRFSNSDTLLRLYPQEFWMAAGAMIVGLVVVQAIALLLVMRRVRRAAG